MAEIPTPRSYPQTLGGIIDAFLSKQGIQNLRAGSPLLSIFEAAAQSDMRSSQDIFDLLNAVSLDKATGLALVRIGEEEGVPKLTESPATGTVTINDTSFTKLASKLYQGRPAPIIGSTEIHVTDASDWDSTGSVYIGRGTSNYEGALAYSAKTDNTTHWTLTLSSPTTKLHNVGESVIVAQGGNRSIGAGTIVKTPQANINDSVEFRVLYTVTMPDGETELTGVQVVAEKAGFVGNVPAGAISAFATEPFTGATVTNPLPYSNARETQTDDEYREAIKKARRTRTKGTALAIVNGVTGITSADENKRVTSASLVTRTGYPTTLYLDDGTGYEEITAGVAVETLVDSALGGEQFFQVKRRPIAKAFLMAHNAAPYLLSAGDALTVRVGGVTYTHTFNASEFASISSASAHEVVSSINGNDSLGFLARTSDSGSRVVLFAKTDSNEELEVVGGVTEVFLFPQGVAYSLQLYRNDRLLQKDGRPAAYPSSLFGEWDSISGNKTLSLKVDGTPEQTYTFTDADFIDNETGFTQVGNNTLDAWVTVLNAKIPGVTARSDAGRIVLTSNLGPSSRAAVEVTDGSLVTVRMFSLGGVEGVNRDYTVDRNTGQIRLETALAEGDRLSIGSASTRSFLESLTVNVTTTVDEGRLWFSVDGDATGVAHGISGATPLDFTIAGVHDWGHRLKIEAGAAAVFANVREGDWMIGWDANLPASLQNSFRVSEVERDSEGEVLGTYITIERPGAMMARGGHRTVDLVPVAGDIAKVFTCGGYTRSFEPDLLSEVQGVTSACEIFDVNNGNERTAAKSMTRARAYHTATVLADGRVLVTGGVSLDNEFLATSEIYDPSTDSWTGGPALPEAVAYHTATLLATGDVFICGGFRRDADGNPVVTSMACRFNAGLNTITSFAGTPMGITRAQHRATLLADGRVLIAGGMTNALEVTNDVEIYDPAGPTTTTVSAMFVPRRDFGMTAETAGGIVYVAGNHRLETSRDNWEEYDVGTDTWSFHDSISPSAEPIFLESQDLYLNLSGDPVMFGGYKWDEVGTGKHRVVMELTGGAWVEHAGNPLNTDTHTHWEKQWAQINRADLSEPNLWVGVGGVNASNFKPVAQIERFDANTGVYEWLNVEDTVDTALPLTSPPGLAFVRTEEPLQPAVLPVGSNYTASSLVSFLNGVLKGATATTYKTSKLRVATNSFGLEGDIALVAGDETGLDTFQLSTNDAIDNLVGHNASVETTNPEAGTPTFEEVVLQGEALQTDADFEDSLILNTMNINGGHQLVGLRSQWAGTPTSFHKRYGGELNFRIKSGFVTPGDDSEDGTRFDSRNANPAGEFTSWERFYAGAQYAISHEDDLVVQIDQDENKRYDINMWRALRPTTNVYGITNTLKDLDGGNVSLAVTFGLDYDFNDFTVHMKARSLAFSADAARRSLFRYFRHGPDGEFARVRFANPDEPDADIAIETDNLATKSNIRIKLSSGAARTPSLRSSSRLAYACTSQTGSVGTLVFAVGYGITVAERLILGGQARFRLSLPASVTDCGLAPADVIYVNSSDPNFPSDPYTVVTVDPAAGTDQDIYCTRAGGGADPVALGGAIGTASLDAQGEVLLSGASISAGDYLRILEGTSVDTFWEETTFRITTVGTQHVVCTSGEAAFFDFLVDPDMAIRALNAPDNLSIFAASAPTITAIAAAVNAAAAEDNAICPITMTSLGTGAGTVDRSTPEELLTQDWYDLSDGINWVSKTTSPVNTSGQYDLSFKKAITGSLATNADWANEEVRITPTTADNLVNWLNTPAVTGLYATAIIQASAGGAKVQIASRKPGSEGSVHVQGGLANSATVAVKGDAREASGKGVSTALRSASAGLTSGMWCSIDNTYTVPKSSIFTSLTELVTWGADGLVEVDSDVYTTWLNPVNAKLTFERQGDFVGISVTGLEQERFDVVEATREAATNTYSLTLKVPTGLVHTGWQVGDIFNWDASTTHEVVLADRTIAGDLYTLHLRLPPGQNDSGYEVGDAFSLTSWHADFPTGSYTVTAVNAPVGQIQTIEFVNATVGSDVSVAFPIGRVVRADDNFGAGDYTIATVSAYNEIDETQTITFTAPALTDDTALFLGVAAKEVDWSIMEEGDLVRISAAGVETVGWSDKQVPVQNQGIFRVVRMQDLSDVAGRAGTLWIENPDAVEGTFEARVAAYDYNSVIPGDRLVVNSAIWGAQNMGSWIVEKVGVETADSDDEFVNIKKFKVSLEGRAPVSIGSPGPLGSEVGLVQIVEGRPARLVKKIEGICPNQDDGTYLDIRWDTALHLQQISSNAGSVVSALDKLAFPIELASGVDGYSYNTGLIGEANRVVYGEPSDTATYPGIAAAGAQININGPLVRRLKLALQLRVRTGSSNNDIASRVRSAVATVVNQVGVGQPVAISAIISAASKVVGVISVTMISPIFNAANDLIAIQPFEKPLIANLTQDIHITFAGE